MDIIAKMESIRIVPVLVLNDLKEGFGYYFAVEPYASYKDYFN